MHGLDQGTVGTSGGDAAYAALDLGTNNCRLLVARPTPGGFAVVDAFSRVVRLGEGLTQNGRLSEEAMDRAVAALRICARKVRRWGVQRARAVATEACRRADNGAVFLQRAADAAGMLVETIEPGEEASLALAGCQSLLSDACDRGILVDIGGGSTQIVWFSPSTDAGHREARLLAWISLPFGVISLAERHRGLGQADLFATVDEEMAPYLMTFDSHNGVNAAALANRVQAIGTSGTITTLAGVALGLARYERSRVDGARMTCDEIAGLSERLAGLTVDQRARIPCIGRSRADLVVAGCAILLSICRHWPVEAWTVADRGLREGILMDLMVADGHRVA